MSQSPIAAIDHLTIGVANLSEAAADYAALLGCSPRWQGEIDEAPAAVFFAGNLWLCLAERDSPHGLERVCFRVDSAERMSRRLARVGIPLLQLAADPLVGFGVRQVEGHGGRVVPRPMIGGFQQDRGVELFG